MLSKDSFDFFEFDDNILDPDFTLSESNTENNNNLLGIYTLISSDSEKNENV